MTLHKDSQPASPAARARDGWVSPHQLGVARLVVGLLALFYIGFFPAEVPLNALNTNEWLQLPRGVRGSLRLGSFLLCALLLAGWFRQVVGALLLGLLALLANYGRLDPVVAGVLGVSLAAAVSQRGDDPLALSPFSGNAGREPTPLPYFSRWIWPWLTLPVALGLILEQGWLPAPLSQAFGLLLGAGATLIAARGVERWSALALLVAWAVGLLLASGPTAMPAWFSLLLLCAHRDWLPPRTAVLLPADEDPTSLNEPDPPIVFYDGVCGLCQSSVRLIVAEDRDARLMHAPLQGQTAQRLLGVTPDDKFDSLKLHDEGMTYERSTGALRIASYLGGFWTLVSWCQHVPAPLRDAVYDFIAENRYAWFGKLDACGIPTPSERRRFLD